MNICECSDNSIVECLGVPSTFNYQILIYITRSISADIRKVYVVRTTNLNLSCREYYTVLRLPQMKPLLAYEQGH